MFTNPPEDPEAKEARLGPLPLVRVLECSRISTGLFTDFPSREILIGG